jgi:hypothetical protein
MTVVAQAELASPSHGTMLTFAAYTHGREGFLVPAVCAQVIFPGKS